MRSEKLKRFIEYSIPLIGIALLIHLLLSIDVKKIASTMLMVHPVPFLLSVSMVGVRIPLGTLKWYILSRDQNIKVKYSRMLSYYLISFFYAAVTPGGIGNYIRVKYLHDEGNDTITSIVNVAVDSLIEMINLHMMSLFILLVFFPSRIGLFSLVIVLLISSAAPFFVILKCSTDGRIVRFVTRTVIPRRYRKEIEEKLYSISRHLPKKKTLVQAFLISLFTWLICFLQIYPIAMGMNLYIPLLDLISLWIVANSISFLPITVSGLGVREWLVITLAENYNVKEAVSISLSLLGYTATTLIPAIIGAIITSLLHFSPNLGNNNRRK